MLPSKSCFILSYIKHVRYSSGYKMNSDNYTLRKLPENYSEQDAFREKVDRSVLKRARTKMRGFDRVEFMDLVKKGEGADPNEMYRDRTDLSTYRSFKRYFESAESERRKQREGVWWKTLNFWLKQREDRPEFYNIGYNLPKRTKREIKSYKNEIKKLRMDTKLEKLARERTLILDPEVLMSDWETGATGLNALRTIAHHYNIYQDLFGNADFFSVLPIEIGYECGEDAVNPVYCGNELLPSEAASEPIVYYEAQQDKQYTLILTNPDENLEDNDTEYIHWLVGNIPGNQICDGEVLADYLRPFPARGTGYQRMVFVLFEQTEKICFDSERRRLPCTLLRERNFKTSEFFSNRQKHLKPVSLRFFQCKWEESVQRTFHEILKMPEPVYEYAKLSEKPRLGRLTRQPHRKTLQWLSRFMPKEPVYPDKSPEYVNLRRQATLDASAAPKREDRKHYPVKNVY